MRERQMVNEEDEAKFRCEIAPIAVGPAPASAFALAGFDGPVGCWKLGQALDR
jgi:hypothetical protein